MPKMVVTVCQRRRSVEERRSVGASGRWPGLCAQVAVFDVIS